MSGVPNEPITRKQKVESEITKSQSECFESICKTCAGDENLQNSELAKIIEAIDEYLRGVKESNDIKKSKFSDQKGSEFSERFRNKIKSVGKQMGNFFGAHRKTIVNVLNTVGSSHWTAIGIVLVASALDRLETVKENRKECLMLLKSMNDLAKIVFELKGLHHETLNTQEKMKEAINMIIEGAIMCAKVTQANGMDHARDHKEKHFHCRRETKEMRNAPDYKEKLLDIRRETKEMRNTLHAQISVCIFKWVCENGKESPEKKYTSPNTQDGVVIDDKSPGNDNSTVAIQTRDVSNKRDCDPPETPSPSKRAKIGGRTT